MLIFLSSLSSPKYFPLCWWTWNHAKSSHAESDQAMLSHAKSCWVRVMPSHAESYHESSHHDSPADASHSGWVQPGRLGLGHADSESQWLALACHGPRHAETCWRSRLYSSTRVRAIQVQSHAESCQAMPGRGESCQLDIMPRHAELETLACLDMPVLSHAKSCRRLGVMSLSSHAAESCQLDIMASHAESCLDMLSHA